MTPNFEEPTDADLTCALETAPAVHVSDDFAARVMARLPQDAPSTVSTRHARALVPRYGRYAAFAALSIVLLAMFVVTQRAAGSSAWTAMQCVLLAQLAAYTVWIGVATWRSQ